MHRSVIIQSMAPQNAPSASASALRHNNALDGIRGLAILLVLARHLIHINASIDTPTYNIVRGLHDVLFCGVDVFFALSGFLITRILIHTVTDPHFFRSFYARRSLRIFPLYYGVLLVLLACTPLLHVHWGGQQWRLLTYSNRLFESRQNTGWNFHISDRVSLVNFWSLHIEEQFYMLWPLFVFLIRSPRRLLSFAAGTSLLALVLRIWMQAHGFSNEYLYTSLVTRMDGLLIGACLAIALQTRFHTIALKLATPVFVGATLLFGMDYILQQRPATAGLPGLYPLEFTLLALASTALVAMCLKPQSRTAQAFRSPFLRFFGRYSYGLYVFHSILPVFGLEWLISSIQDHIHPSSIANLVNAGLELALTLAISMASYHFFEMPFLKLKRYFQPQVAEAPAEPASATA
jgi:peptidoglycan/LPS O-acetylase OafA/YrhL